MTAMSSFEKGLATGKLLTFFSKNKENASDGLEDLLPCRKHSYTF